MFQFPAYAHDLSHVPCLQHGGFPHSDTCGSNLVCRSPHFFAACRVLHRSWKPRHPPYALFSLFSRIFCSRRNRSPYYPFSLIQTALFFYLSIFFPILSMNVKPGDNPRICLQYQTRRNPKKTAVADSSKKEVFQPHLPVRLPCYDLAPVTGFALGRSLRSRTSGTPGSHGLTGGVYKARERIHRAMADARLLANPTSWSRVADSNPNWDMI